MNLLSRRSVLAIAAVVDVALHSRSAPVAAKALAARHKLPPRHLETLLQGLVHAKILKGVRGPRGGYELARERGRITVGEIVRTAMSLSTADPDDLGANSALLERAIDPPVRRAGETFSPISIRSPSNRCAKRPKKPMCSTTRRRPAILQSDHGICGVL
jgi:Rrf2 family iron-sulfur cluster assembly transcriptional regulator